jgi:2-oxoglutarate ferredoxin oxidoreductase subunit beta
MTDIPLQDIPTYTRKDFVSDQTVRWCPGCGDYAILAAVQKTLPDIGVRREDIVFISGIGCSSRFPYYMNTYGIHSIHGRAPTLATGLKLANPHLQVWVVTGDGDGLSIGGNHLIHAARRNVDLTCILFNNAVYGMTGGQTAPTTQPGWVASTAPYGHPEPAFDGCALAEAAGATFVARGTAYDPLGLEAILREALRHPGFSYVEVLTDCPVYFGRYNRLGEGPELLWSQKARFTEVGRILAQKRFVTPDGAAPPGRVEGLRFGVLHRSQRAEFSQVCWSRVRRGEGP